MFERITAKVLTLNDLRFLRERHHGKRIVFCTGCYDIMQSGHAVFFSQCRELGDLLVVGVGSDAVISLLKGPSRPVNPENNRLYLVAAMHEVDYAVLNDTKLTRGKIDFEPVIEALRPDVFVLNDDDSDKSAKEELCGRLGVSIRFVPRVVPQLLQATSTTNIIDKINFSFKAPLRIDFAGGWADVPAIMGGRPGFVSNAAIRPHVESKNGTYNFSGYPRGSGLSTSTATTLLEMICAPGYCAASKSLTAIAEDLFSLENRELNWAIGRQDQYAIVYGGFHCFEFGEDYGKALPGDISRDTLDAFHRGLLLLHTGVSRNAQRAVEEVYRNHATAEGREALDTISACGRKFHEAIKAGDFIGCAAVMEENFAAQKRLAPSSSSGELDEMYRLAKANGAYGGKICGAGGGGAFIFYCKDPAALKLVLKKRFIDSFEIDFEFEHRNIKELNNF